MAKRGRDGHNKASRGESVWSIRESAALGVGIEPEAPTATLRVRGVYEKPLCGTLRVAFCSTL